MTKELGILLFPKIAEAPIFKCKPWKPSAECLARLEEIDRHQRIARATANNYWFD